jgi:hypothetical protein
MKRRRKRNRPRDIDDKEERPPIHKANILVWSMAVGILVGLLGLTVGLTIDLPTATKLAIIGFVLGAGGGAIAAMVDRVPTNKYRSGWKRKFPRVATWWRPESPVPHLSDEYYYHKHEPYRNDEEEDKD